MNVENICYGCFREKEPGERVCLQCGFDETEEQPFLALPLGAILNGRYMVGKVLGVGGFGIIYLGFDLTLEIKVAIKEYMPSGLATRQTDRCTVTLTGRTGSDYQSGMERFLDEARILAKLQDTPNIVSVQNYFKENNTAYFVMEYIEGTSLKELVTSEQNTSQSPGNSKGIKMTEYESTYYNAVMKIPDNFAKTEDGVFEFVSENGSSIDLSYYTSNSGFPVYDLSDLEENKEIYVDYYVSSHSDEDIQGCDIVDSGSRTVGDAAGYQICFETTDSQGATKQILAVFIEGTNGYGCYQILASYPKEDSQTKDEVLASIDTFQSNGKSEVLEQLFTDERLPYKFLYMETHAPDGVQVMENEDGEYNAIVYPVEGDEITLLLVVTLPEGYGSSEEILSAMIEGLKEGFPSGKEDIVFSIDAGGYTWKMQEYDCGEQGVCIQNAVVEMDGTFFYLMMLTTEETRDTVYGIMFDVMDSIRPTT